MKTTQQQINAAKPLTALLKRVQGSSLLVVKCADLHSVNDDD